MMAFINDLSPEGHLSGVHITRLSLKYRISGNLPLIYHLDVVRNFWFTMAVSCHHWQTHTPPHTHTRTCAHTHIHTHQSPARVRLTRSGKANPDPWVELDGLNFLLWVTGWVGFTFWVQVVVLWEGLGSAASRYSVTANVYAIRIPCIAI